MSDYVFAKFDLIELGWLPNDWEENLAGIAQNQSVETRLDGASVTSREEKKDIDLEVFVVTGDIVKKELSWLHQLYKSRFRSLASAVMNQNMTTHQDEKAGINVNSLRGVNTRYEWHVDSNPLTGLLFGSTHKQGEGGELVFKKGDHERIISPVAGTLLFFDAREVPHTVYPLKDQKTRISVPMNFYFEDGIQERPADLDGYLYETK